MSIRFDCPHCKANYEVADDLGGKIIMCRLCQKRGPVRSAGTAGSAGAALSPAALAAAKLGAEQGGSATRRNFLLLGAASLAAIATGALLARPWRYRGSRSTEPLWPGGGPGQFRMRGQPPGGGKKDGKSGAV